jgi:hypothetical protein
MERALIKPRRVVWSKITNILKNAMKTSNLTYQTFYLIKTWETEVIFIWHQ